MKSFKELLIEAETTQVVGFEALAALVVDMASKKQLKLLAKEFIEDSEEVTKENVANGILDMFDLDIESTYEMIAKSGIDPHEHLVDQFDESIDAVEHAGLVAELRQKLPAGFNVGLTKQWSDPNMDPGVKQYVLITSRLGASGDHDPNGVVLDVDAKKYRQYDPEWTGVYENEWKFTSISALIKRLKQIKKQHQ